ncbi:hypothetical protein FD37_GL000571 [Levilactobacillus spicheri DSM 15429]|uniref:Uncharacterized protein n=1 Tax=Levilactobacillus spicheri DSM 15429 TaxID=1423805 RepID=A0A0R1QUV5_9LACO|nr:hypothetical protein FD37_GL000571 [Levilactobacillus spicheri DSM 15429]
MALSLLGDAKPFLCEWLNGPGLTFQLIYKIKFSILKKCFALRPFIKQKIFQHYNSYLCR